METKENKLPTLFGDSLEDIAFCLLKKHKRPETKQKIRGDYFFMLSAKKNTYERYFFELHDHYIFCRKDEKHGEIAFIDILNSFLKITADTQINGEPHFGLKFIKQRTYEELLTSDQSVAEAWSAALAAFCVLTRFRNHYETKRVLGRGSFGKVFLVEHKASGQQRAAKVFSKAVFLQDPLSRKSVANEIAMLRLMKHPRVVRLRELFEGSRFVYCVLELYRGSDLLSAIARTGPQPEPKALAVIQQVLEALAYMHSLGVLHRDLKPDNVIFREGQEGIDLGLVDLGFASRESEVGALFRRCGTPGFVAPEVLADASYDCKADVFSAGAVFYVVCAH